MNYNSQTIVADIRSSHSVWDFPDWVPKLLIDHVSDTLKTGIKVYLPGSETTIYSILLTHIRSAEILTEFESDLANKLYPNYTQMCLCTETIAIGTQIDNDELIFIHNTDINSTHGIVIGYPSSACTFIHRTLTPAMLTFLFRSMEWGIVGSWTHTEYSPGYFYNLEAPTGSKILTVYLDKHCGCKRLLALIS